MYQTFNGTSYHKETSREIIEILDNALNSYQDIRIRVCYGDAKTGKDWEERFGVCGYIGRSTGRVKIPLMISKINSLGGSAISDHCIVKIEKKYRGEQNYKTVYQHKNYHKGA